MGLKGLISDALFGEAHAPTMNDDQKHDFNTAMVRGINKGTIANLTDVSRIYKAVTGFRATEIPHLPGLGLALRELFKNAVADKRGPRSIPFELGTISDAVIARTRNFLDEVEAIAPYDGLPALERSLMVDISASVDRGDIEGANQKMLHLANSIQDRSRALRRNRKATWWSTVFAVAGVALAAVQLLVQFTGK